MFYPTYPISYHTGASREPSLLDWLKQAVPDLLLSIGVSIVGSILLTAVSYGLSVSFGLPIFPFLFIRM